MPELSGLDYSFVWSTTAKIDVRRCVDNWIDRCMPDSEDRQIDWSIPHRCLLLGVAGFGMRALVEILHQSGHTVYGSDSAFGIGPESLNGTHVDALAANVEVVPWEDSSPAANIEVCICSPAIPVSAPLRRWAVDRSIPVLSLHAAVNAVFAERSQICVTGTHGKSTTSALLAWMLNNTGMDAGVFVGAHYNFGDGIQSRFANQGGHYGRGSVAVIEACEFERSFLQLNPHHIVLTGIDGDHFDCFDTEDAAYREFLEKVPTDGIVLVNAACSRGMSVTAEAGVATVRWSLCGQRSTDWSGRIVGVGSGEMTLRIRHGERGFCDVRAPLVGRHNADNLLGAVAAASNMGMSAIAIQNALSTFPGLKRRLEYRGDYRGMQMLDDYAHHPTAVTTTLQAVRQQFPGRRIRVFFEPHQVCRLRRCRNQFIRALLLADELAVLPVFPAREQVSVATCHRISQDLAATICDMGTPAVFADGVSTAVSIVENTGQPEDVFVTMGAGTVHRIHDEFHRRFQRHSTS